MTTFSANEPLVEQLRWYVESFGKNSATALYEMILERGREFTPAPLPANVRRLPLQRCFLNSEMTARSYGYAYVEGYAISSKLVGLPIHHAWNVTKDGIVIDTTWEEVGLEYFGVEIPEEDWVRSEYLTALGVFAG